MRLLMSSAWAGQIQIAGGPNNMDSLKHLSLHVAHKQGGSEQPVFLHVSLGQFTANVSTELAEAHHLL